MRERDRILDEISLREASLADARVELASGELDESAFRDIEARESAALALAREALAALGDEPVAAGAAPRVRRRRRALLVVALAAFVLAGAVTAWASLRPRQVGDSITGSISLSPAQQVTQLLSQAESDIAAGDVAAALSAYEQVLALKPSNVEALTQSGWLDFSAGSTAKDLSLVRLGEQRLAKAVSIAPTNPGPWLYLGIIAASTKGDEKLATSDFERFVRLQPSSTQLAIARPFLRRFHVATK